MIELLPGRLIEAALIARFTSEIDPEPLTSPKVLIAKLSVPVGAIAAVTKMSPSLDPSSAPMRRVPALMLLISPLSKESLSAFWEPKSISLSAVLGAMVTTPDVAEISTEVLSVIESA